MKRIAFAISIAAVMLAGCANQPPQSVATLRPEQPSYQTAANNAFLASSEDAITKLTANLDPQVVGSGPVLVATIVNVNNMGTSAPLGRTLSELYATQMAGRGFNVKEIKLRGDIYVREGTGELLLSREVRDIALSYNAALVLVGTYSPAAGYTYVSLKLVRTADSRIITGYDYALPNDRDVNRLLGNSR